MFLDLNFRGSSFENNLKLADEAFKYGWNHINFSYNQNDFSDALDFKDDLKSELGESIDYTLEIKPNNVNEIRKISNKFRKNASCITVVGGDLKINRAAVENVKIDVLSRPYLRRFDCGINQVLAKEAVRNNVAIELCFKDVLKTYLSPRSKTISNFKDIYTLYYKFDFPLILSSGSECIYDIKTPQDFTAFFTQTGLSREDVDKSFENANSILRFNENRQNMILKGVRRVDDEA